MIKTPQKYRPFALLTLIVGDLTFFAWNKFISQTHKFISQTLLDKRICQVELGCDTPGVTRRRCRRRGGFFRRPCGVRIPPFVYESGLFPFISGYTVIHTHNYITLKHTHIRPTCPRAPVSLNHHQLLDLGSEGFSQLHLLASHTSAKPLPERRSFRLQIRNAQWSDTRKQARITVFSGRHRIVGRSFDSVDSCNRYVKNTPILMLFYPIKMPDDGNQLAQARQSDVLAFDEIFSCSRVLWRPVRAMTSSCATDARADQLLCSNLQSSSGSSHRTTSPRSDVILACLAMRFMCMHIIQSMHQ